MIILTYHFSFHLINVNKIYRYNLYINQKFVNIHIFNNFWLTYYFTLKSFLSFDAIKIYNNIINNM